MCGGRLDKVPCSHVGHIFRHRAPYKGREGVQYVQNNLIRLAKVWLDGYAKYFYVRIGNKLVRFTCTGDKSDFHILYNECVSLREITATCLNVLP